ncbi:MMS19 nucleotide excision repair protein homolog [Anthonomus grandis grandis]|uniref:MMS19 nucleotide excision repair protein homolog n=1 Tax=Anthonomus grandis grandis TaxID=2921223 RepID=UPI002165985F|nr:MMS19 nucleotide excision repair protein homolog [Anthonomus grandis grandis]
MEIDKNFSYLSQDNLLNLSKNDDQLLKVSQKLADDLRSKGLTFVEVTLQLGCLLLDPDYQKREIGVLVISNLVNNLKSEDLNPQELAIISTYFCDKLKEHHQVAVAALTGTKALVNFNNTPTESIINLLSSIFNHIVCQQQQQSDRYLIFEIYEIILRKHEKAITSMGIDFVFGVMSSIDGERDPKNLLYIFKWLQDFLSIVQLGHLDEEMFDVLSCYFPVDFKTPPSDKNKITREELAQGLGKCLTGTSVFGQYAIPLALEKLDSALKVAKEDSLALLQLGCETYEASIYNQYSIELWSLLQKEIINTSDNDLRKRCLETLKDILMKLSHLDQHQFECIISNILDNLRGNLFPESKLYSASSSILIYVANSSKPSSVMVAKKIGPLLENTFKITEKPEHKASILLNLIQVVKAVINTHILEVDMPIIEEISACPKLLAQAILDDENEALIKSGYKGFAEIPAVIPQTVRQTYFEVLTDTMNKPLQKDVQEALLESLKSLAKKYPQDVKNFVSQNCQNINGSLSAVENYLLCLATLATLPSFKDTAIDLYIYYATSDVAKSIVALSNLQSIITDEIVSLLISKQFLEKFVGFLENLDEGISNTDFLKNICEILQRIIRAQYAEMQQSIYLTHSNRKFKNKTVFLAFLAGLIHPLRPGVFRDNGHFDLLLSFGRNADDKFVRDLCLQVVSSILNKTEEEKNLEDRLTYIKTTSEGCTAETRVWLTSWVTKALTIRNHPNAWQWTDCLFRCLEECSKSSIGFNIIMDDSNSYISRENYCQIMPLYKQKFFVYCMNKFCEPEYNDCINDNHLSAIGYLVKGVPSSALIIHFKKILRLLILCLEKCTNPKILEILLNRISEFVQQNEKVIEDNLEDILFRILNLANFQASMNVRIAALKCLGQMTLRYKIYQLLPFKERVLSQLSECLDDKKRLVRREAMECRCLWFFLDAPQ